MMMNDLGLGSIREGSNACGDNPRCFIGRAAKCPGFPGTVPDFVPCPGCPGKRLQCPGF